MHQSLRKFWVGGVLLRSVRRRHAHDATGRAGKHGREARREAHLVAGVASAEHQGSVLQVVLQSCVLQVRTAGGRR